MYCILVDEKLYLICDSREDCEANIKGLLAPATQQRARIISKDELTINMTRKG